MLADRAGTKRGPSKANFFQKIIFIITANRYLNRVNKDPIAFYVCNPGFVYDKGTMNANEC